MAREVVGQVTVGGKALPIAKANIASGLVFLSGQLPIGADGAMVKGPIEAQTRQTLENLKAALGECGCGLEDVVKVTVWLTDPSVFSGFNAVYAEYFASQPPARSTAICGLTVDALIELDVIAARP
jgi:reactive intermediate/imine deaminase